MATATFYQVSRTCPTHHQLLASPCGQFDALCTMCEYESDLAWMNDEAAKLQEREQEWLKEIYDALPEPTLAEQEQHDNELAEAMADWHLSFNDAA